LTAVFSPAIVDRLSKVLQTWEDRLISTLSTSDQYATIPRTK